MWLVLLLAVADPPPWKEAPLDWTDERAALTIEYRRAHEGGESLAITPKVVVVHHTGGGGPWKATWRYFNKPLIEAARGKRARAGRVNVSSHFLVDRDGTIYRLQPETRFARHAVGMNHVAIGIENVGDGAKHKLTDAQLEADARLIRWLRGRYAIEHVVGPHEITDETPYFKELDPKYRNQKPDPGAAFMRRLRDRL